MPADSGPSPVTGPITIGPVAPGPVPPGPVAPGQLWLQGTTVQQSWAMAAVTAPASQPQPTAQPCIKVELHCSLAI